MANWEMELDKHPQLGLQKMLGDQRRESNSEFSKYVEKNYQAWINRKDNRPNLSTDIIEKYVVKGKEIAIEGKLTHRSYEDKNGEKRYITEVVIDELMLLGSK
jgi:proteasome lid subunit RPN8/RPN11